MIEEVGIVTSVSGDHALVRTERKAACGSCDVSGACGTSLLEKVFGRRSVELRALNRADAVVGDRVCVGVSELGLLRSAIAAYLAPVAALIVGAWLGEAFGGRHAELLSLMGALLGLALALLWLRSYSVALVRRTRYQPIVLRRLSSVSEISVAPPGTPGAK